MENAHIWQLWSMGYEVHHRGLTRLIIELFGCTTSGGGSTRVTTGVVCF